MDDTSVPRATARRSCKFVAIDKAREVEYTVGAAGDERSVEAAGRGPMVGLDKWS